MMSSSSCGGMAGITLRQRERLADPPRDQRNVGHIGVHGGDSEHADEAVLDRVTPGMLADHDDVGVGAVAQEAGNRGLRQHQQVVAVGELRKYLLAQPQDAEATRRVNRRLPVTHRATLIAQQHEIAVGEPTQQRCDVLTVRSREPSLRVGVEFIGQAEQCPCQRSRVDRHLACVGEHAGQQALGLRQHLGVDGTGQLNVDPGLVDAFLGVVGLQGGLDLEHLSARAAPHPQHRVHDRLVRHPEPVQQRPSPSPSASARSR